MHHILSTCLRKQMTKQGRMISVSEFITFPTSSLTNKSYPNMSNNEDEMTREKAETGRTDLIVSATPINPFLPSIL